jgi:hypothetical protein
MNIDEAVAALAQVVEIGPPAFPPIVLLGLHLCVACAGMQMSPRHSLSAGEAGWSVRMFWSAYAASVLSLESSVAPKLVNNWLVESV